MRIPLLMLALVAAPAPAQEPEWRTAQDTEVALRAFGYEPRMIRLPADRPVRLRFVNNSRSTLSFAAPGFFRAARVRSRDSDLVVGGSLRLAPGERRTVALVPARGRYRLHSGNLAHRLLGMRGTIVAE